MAYKEWKVEAMRNHSFVPILVLLFDFLDNGRWWIKPPLLLTMNKCKNDIAVIATNMFVWWWYEWLCFENMVLWVPDLCHHRGDIMLCWFDAFNYHGTQRKWCFIGSTGIRSVELQSVLSRSILGPRVCMWQKWPARPRQFQDCQCSGPRRFVYDKLYR